MKKLIFLIILLQALFLHAQTQQKYWIQFTDKNNSPYSISNPSAYLSARAIARRTKYNIPVQLNDLPPNPNYIDSVLSKGVQLLNRCGWLNAISVYAPDTNDMPLIRQLPFVVGARHVTSMASRSRSNNSQKRTFKETNNITRVNGGADTFNYGYAYAQYHQIGIDCINNMGYRGSGKQIAVIDSRFGRADTSSAFDTLRMRGQILGTHDFVWGINKVYDTNNSDIHGEMTLSCMVGSLPGKFMGDAMEADYYLLRTENIYSEYQIEDDNWASAAEYADSAGADIISSSLGYSTFDDASTSYTYADMNGRTTVASIAATIAAEKGMVVCVSAGNDGGDGWNYIDSPADADSILAVGAVDASGTYASFSSIGPTADHRIKPDVVAMGMNAAVCSPYGGVTYASGTSFSTPIIAGAVASLWQAHPNASNFTIMNAIKQSASKYSHPGDSLGYGIPNFCLAHTIIINGINNIAPLVVLNKVYPNPFNNSITAEVYSSVEQNLEVCLYNSLGQLVYKSSEKVMAKANTLIAINGLNSLSQGLYLVSIQDTNGTIYSGKVVKQ
jgi:hypothetical protein